MAIRICRKIHWHSKTLTFPPATANAIFYDDISGRETAQEECSDTSAFLVNELPPEEPAE